MTLVASTMARLVDRVPSLNNRVFGAADLSELVRQRAPSPHPVSAYVLPLGIVGGRDTALTGSYRQDVSRRIGVVLMIRTTDTTGARAVADVEAFIDSIMLALCGWTPDPGTTGVTRLERAEFLSMEGGTLIYQVDFSLADFVRVFP